MTKRHDRSTPTTPPSVEVVTYARYSTDRQNDRSIADQQRLCSETCRRLGLPLPLYHFYDAARSGASLAGRDGLRKLLDYAAHPAARGVRRVLVVESLDRLGRNIFDSFEIVRRLHREGGMRIVTADGRDSDTPAFKAMLLADSFVADVMLDHHRTHVRRGLEARVAEGRWVTPPPLGYRIEEGRLVRLPDDAPEVRQVRREFEMAAAGLSLPEISRRINAEGYRTTRDGLRYRLGMAIYRGEVRWTGNLVRQDESLRLVSDGVWHAARARLRRRTERFGGHRRTNSNLVDGGALARRAPLSGLLRCGLCGRPISRTATTQLKDGSLRHYYGCINATSNRTCSATRRVQAAPLERAVVDAVLDAVFDERAVASLVREVERGLAAAASDVASEQRRLESALRDTERRLRHCIEYVEQGESAAVRERITELEAQVQELRNRLRGIRPPPPLRVLRSSVVEYLHRAAESLRTEDPIRLRAALEGVMTDGVITPVEGTQDWRVTFRVAPLGVIRDLLVGNVISGGKDVLAHYIGTWYPFTLPLFRAHCRCRRPSLAHPRGRTSPRLMRPLADPP